MFVYNLLMDTESTNKPKVRKRKAALNVSFSVKKERNTLYQKVSTILQKTVAERSKDESEFLCNSKDIVAQITLRKAQRQKVKDRTQEYEDPANILAEKCKTLAEAVKKSNHLVVYTGAGISTAACIPDYRGSNGIWTLLQKGKDIGLHDLSQAEPTLTHMALYGLYRSGVLKHVVSQNCDGLHLRSGLPRTVLSEVHGNMYLEVCTKCKPCNHYLRLFDVTEYTARYSHETLRLCYKCGNPLKDTIVHFGERGKLQWPLNWDTACKQADMADVILCLGSSLKVLKKYPWLWCMDKAVKKRPKLYIVNLQWTPKDDHSTLKINGKCDTVIEQMMLHLGLTIPEYVRTVDPIFHHATILSEAEVHTTSRTAIVKQPQVKQQNEDTTPDDPSTGKECDAAPAAAGIDSVCLDIKPKLCPAEDCTSTTTNDLTSTNNLLVTTEGVDAIQVVQCALDTNSDKENENEIMSNSKKLVRENDVDIKVEKMVTDDEPADLIPVANAKSLVVFAPESAVSGVEAAITHSKGVTSESSDTSDMDASVCVRTNVVSGVPIQPYLSLSTTIAAAMYTNSSLSLLCGQSLWSDLSLFDALTHQPILFGPSILGWSDMNACSSLVPYQSTEVSSLAILPKPVATSLVKKQAESVKCALPSPLPSSTGHAVAELLKPAPIAACLFCLQYYTSHNCLFYAACPSNTPLHTNSVCLCCGGEDDDEEQQEEQDDDRDKSSPKVPNVNPGWFGKGYKKKLKKRR